MKLRPHHLIALAGGSLVAGIALTDAVTHGLTGHSSVFSDDSGRPGWQLAASVAHGLCYLTLLNVLVRERPLFRTASRLLRLLWVVLSVSLGVLAAGFLAVLPVLQLLNRPSDGSGVGGALGNGAFAGMILGSLLLGLATLRRNPLGVGARLLAVMLPLLGITVLLGVLGSDWAHPAYLEATLSYGLALLGAGAAAPEGSGRDAPVSGGLLAGR